MRIYVILLLLMLSISPLPAVSPAGGAKAQEAAKAAPNARTKVVHSFPQVVKSKRSGGEIQFSGNVMDIPVFSSDDCSMSENSVFINPLEPEESLNSNNSSNWPGRSVFGVSEHVSQNLGVTWTTNFTMVNTSASDPACAVDRLGRMYINYIDGGVAAGQSISFSDNDGVSWTEVAITNPPSSVVHDKNHLWVDNSVVSPFENNLYCAWTNFGGGAGANHEIEVSRSLDRGATWSQPVVISAGIAAYLNQGVNLQTGPHGEVYAVWTVYDAAFANEVNLGFAASFDGGASWTNAVRIVNINGHRYTPLGGSKTMRHASYPSMTVNQQNGHLYVVWTELVGCEQEPETDIFMSRSTDNGATWSTPSRVNQDQPCNQKDQWMPWAACDEVSGAIVVTYYDSRLFPANDEAHTFISLSYNEGINWQDHRISDVSWDADAIASNGYAGDYIGIDMMYCEAIPVWSDKRLGPLLPFTSPFSLTCPDNLSLCNAAIFENAMYSVNDFITVALAASCAYTVEPGGNCKMRAGNRIRLLPGFHARHGSEYSGRIENNCFSFCDRNEFQLENQMPAHSDEVTTLLQELPAQEPGAVSQVYPNPADGEVVLRYSVAEAGPVSLALYNAIGEQVLTLADGIQDADMYVVNFNVSHLPAGVYYYTLRTSRHKEMRKLVVLR